MPFCPECKYEYVAGITKCPDCRVELVDSLVESKPTAGDVPEGARVELVTVGSFPYEAIAQSARLKLESFGIRGVLSNEIIAQTDIILAFADGGVHLMVDKDDAKRAREVLEADDESMVEN